MGLVAVIVLLLSSLAALGLGFSLHSKVLVWFAVLPGVASGILAIRMLRQHLQRSTRRTGQPGASLLRLGIFGLLALCLAVFVAANLLARQRALGLIHPDRHLAQTTPAEQGIPDYQEISFTTQDGLLLNGWYLPAETQAAVILLHGHAGNRGAMLADARILHDSGFSILLYDARNSGTSQGNLTSFGLYEINDLRAALDFVKAQPGIDPNRIGTLGQSMGAATVLLAAAQYTDLRAVVAESAYTSMEDNLSTGVRHLANLPPFPFVPLIVWWGEHESGLNLNQVRPIDTVDHISPRPLLLVHGALDELVPVENAYRLYQAAGEPKDLYIIENAGHGRFPQIGGQAYAEKIATFFKNYLLGK